MKLTGFESNKINSDMVNHPSHYNLPDRKACIDEMIDIYGLKDVAKWCEITAYKYKYRAGHKGSATEDMSKAAWYTVKACSLNLSADGRLSVRLLIDTCQYSLKTFLHGLCYSVCFMRYSFPTHAQWLFQ